MFNKIEDYCLAHNLLPKRSTIIVGLSGGPDSVFLFYFLNNLKEKYNLTLIAAHLNHGWRKQADNDQQFCKKLAQQNNVTFVTDHLKNYPTNKSTGSKEADARHARRAFFAKIKKEHSADLVALGHHAQDQQETFFIRLIRGATLDGLCAMKPKHENYIRPLLQTNKKEIIDYFQQHSLPFIIDESNFSPDFLRNRIRHNVIPAFYATDERSTNNCLRTINNLQDDQKLLHDYTQQTLQELLHTKDGQQWLSCVQLKKLHPALQKRVLTQWLIAQKVPFTLTTSFLHELLKFINSPHGGSHTLHTTWSVVKQQNTLRIERH